MRISLVLKAIFFVVTLPVVWALAKALLHVFVEVSAPRSAADLSNTAQLVIGLAGWLAIFWLAEVVVGIPLFSPVWWCVCLLVGLFVSVYIDTPRQILRALLEPFAWRRVGESHTVRGVKLEPGGTVVLPDGPSLTGSAMVVADEMAVYTVSPDSLRISPAGEYRDIEARYRQDGWHVRGS